MKHKILLTFILAATLIALFAITASATESLETWDISDSSSDNVTATLYDDYTLIICGYGNMDNWSSKDAPWYSSYRNQIKSVIVENSVTNIGNWAFNNCTALTSVEIPDSVTTIGSAAFYNCTALTSIIIGESVTSIGTNAFDSCESLTSIVIPNSVTTIGISAFSWCDSLTSVVIGDSVTTIGNEAFYACTSLTSIVIGDSVTTIGSSAFNYCPSLTSIVIPDSVTTIGAGAFYYCESLTIYAEAKSQPSGWSSEWNFSNCPVIWGYIDKEDCLNKIFTFKGYSSNDKGAVAVGFDIDFEALNLYEELTGEKLEIGVIFAGYDLLNGQNPLDSQGNTITLQNGLIAKGNLTSFSYTTYDFVLTDITEDIYDIPLVIAAYINNGKQNWYIQANRICSNVTGITYNEIIGG